MSLLVLDHDVPARIHPLSDEFAQPVDLFITSVHRLPALIAANSVLAFATNRHTVAASSE
jgi:hypothetical protein